MVLFEQVSLKHRCEETVTIFTRCFSTSLYTLFTLDEQLFKMVKENSSDIFLIVYLRAFGTKLLP